MRTIGGMVACAMVALVACNTGSSRVGGRREANVVQLRFHPNGRRVAFTAGQGGGAEVWSMASFLPPGRMKN